MHCRNHHSWTYKGLPSLGEDAALLNCQDNRWRLIALTSDDQAEKLPPALSAKDAIDDLPADVTAGLAPSFPLLRFTDLRGADYAQSPPTTPFYSAMTRVYRCN